MIPCPDKFVWYSYWYTDIENPYNKSYFEDAKRSLRWRLNENNANVYQVIEFKWISICYNNTANNNTNKNSNN